jgi:hypothetical protein
VTAGLSIQPCQSDPEPPNDSKICPSGSSKLAKYKPLFKKRFLISFPGPVSDTFATPAAPKTTSFAAFLDPSFEPRKTNAFGM